METITVQEQARDGELWVDLKKLITFIAGVINTKMESKSEMIQIIMKAANGQESSHLNISELIWEESKDELSAQTSQETPRSG